MGEITRDHQHKEWFKKDFRLTCRRAKRLFVINGMSVEFEKILQGALHKVTRRNPGEKEETPIKDMTRFAFEHIRICQNPAQWRRLVFSSSRIAATTTDEEEACVGQMHHENGTWRHLNLPRVERHESIASSKLTCHTAANIWTCPSQPQEPSSGYPTVTSAINTCVQ